MSENGDFPIYSSSEGESSDLDYYTPTAFLRCHSKISSDAADVQSHVWQCAFEPSLDNPKLTTNRFASCGGGSVCVIDAKDGSVVTKYYSRDSKEDFRAVAWTSLITETGIINVLAVAGSRSTSHLLHPDKYVCFHEHKVTKSRSVSTEVLMFHPSKSNYLFGAFNNGEVQVWDIGFPYPPEYKCNVKTLKTVYTERGAFALSFSRHCDMLLCATEKGVIGWQASVSALQGQHKLKEKEFHFRVNRKSQEMTDSNEGEFVDSIKAIGDGKLVATKCALHGSIYIWNLQEAVESKERRVCVLPVHVLEWSTTDNFYMNMGINMGATMLACGDDKGNIWLYDIEEKLSLPPQKHKCDAVFAWPDVVDLYADRKRKLSMGVYDIVINSVAFSYNAKYLVAVTNTNLICIWKKNP